MFWRYGTFAIVFIAVRLISLIRRKPQDDKSGELESYHQLRSFPRDEALHKFLISAFYYYQLLSNVEQLMFRNRLKLLLKTTWFAGRKELKVSDSMMLILGATMVQISFGFKNFYFSKINRVIVFPDVFYSNLVGQNLKGLTVFNAGAVFISWPHFEHGLANTSDKINLGLHEFAHALYLDYYGNKAMKNGFSRWTDVAIIVFEEMQHQPEGHFLRKYAATNIHEFWAVCIEHFFEAPVEFKTELPELYLATARVLGQDMAKRILSIQKSDSN
jgi:Mlc titration factor MtfA (ptsG expression regulator)